MSEKEKAEEVAPELLTEEEEVQENLSKEETLQLALDEAKAETEKYKEQYIRVHADFDNSKKRLEREKATAVAYSNEAFARDMLGVLDSLESAIASTEQIDHKECDEAIVKFREGLKLTFDQTVSVLKKHGVEEVVHEGEFDPNCHQVLMQVESETHEKDQIVQVMQKGYTMKDRVIRPAMVSTAK